MNPRNPRAELPADVAAVCFLCGQSFRSINRYDRHRDMDVPFALRTCRVPPIKPTENTNE
jgi:hypothetical protein